MKTNDARGTSAKWPTLAIAISIIAPFISGSGGVYWTLRTQHNAEVRRQKIETIREIAGYRFVLIDPTHANPPDKAHFTAALNQAFVIFADDASVMSALQDFHTAVVGKQGPEIANDKLVSLFKAFARSANLDFSQLNDAFFMQPFNL
jgi:hypothetical protein